MALMLLFVKLQLSPKTCCYQIARIGPHKTWCYALFMRRRHWNRIIMLIVIIAFVGMMGANYLLNSWKY